MTGKTTSACRWSTGLALWVCSVAVFLSACSELPTGPAETPQMIVRGITIADWSADGYGTPAANTAVDRIGATGANTMAILVTAYQADVSANEIRVDDERTPTQASVVNLIQRNQTASFPMDIVIKPHVDLDSGEWRGKINPADPSRWFESYRNFIIQWAEFAELWDAGTFIVGTELAGTLEYQDMWRGLIQDVRDVFPGTLVYAASWDEAPLVPFWDAVDMVGVNFYAPVTKRLDTSRFDALAGWQPWIQRIRLLHKQTGLDIVFSEIGYRSVDGAGMHPYDFDRTPGKDLEEQAHLYWAALQALGDKPWIRGIYWWNWLANGASEDESTDYTPADKPAEKELIDAWAP